MTNQTVKINYFDYPRKIKILFFFYIIGFAVGTTTHTIELIQGGFLPYNHVPLWKNIYWTSLTFLDFLAIILILKSIVPALIISNLIIISDVIINISGIEISQLGEYSDNYKLIMQIAFCLYVLITTPIIFRLYKQMKLKPNMDKNAS